MVVVGLGVFTVLVLITLFSSMLPQEKVECLQDSFFIWTEPLNAYFASNEVQKRAYMIISAALVDVMLLVQFCRWSIFGKSWRFAIALTYFYVVKCIVQVSQPHHLSLNPEWLAIVLDEVPRELLVGVPRHLFYYGLLRKEERFLLLRLGGPLRNQHLRVPCDEAVQVGNLFRARPADAAQHALNSARALVH